MKFSNGENWSRKACLSFQMSWHWQIVKLYFRIIYTFKTPFYKMNSYPFWIIFIYYILFSYFSLSLLILFVIFQNRLSFFFVKRINCTLLKISFISFYFHVDNKIEKGKRTFFLLSIIFYIHIDIIELYQWDIGFKLK